MAFNAVKNTILGTLNWCAAFILNRPTQNVGGFFQEPGLTLANLIMSTILMPPFAWQWNRNVANFTTVAGISDYVISLPDFGWLEKVTISMSGLSPSVVELQISPLVAVSGDQQRPFQVCIANDDNAGDITFRLMGLPDNTYTVTLIYQKAPVLATSLLGASVGSITSIAAAVSSTVYTGSFTSGGSNAFAGQYFFVSGTTASGSTTPNNGLYLCTASTAGTITLQNPNGILQAGAGGIVQSLTTWAPVPDKFNTLYERGMLAHLHAMYDAATYAMEIQLFFKQLVGMSEGLSDTAKAIFLEERLAQIRTEAATMAAITAAPKRAV